MVIELEKCPYCGGDGELCTYDVDGEKRLYLVRCEDCGNGTCADEDAYTVIKLWNARVKHHYIAIPKEFLEDEKEEEEEEEVRTVYISLPDNMDKDEKYTKQKTLAEMASDYLSATVELREPYPEEDSNELEILAVRLKSMSEAEYVIFPEGWELERESRIEYETAKEYGKKILLEHGEFLQEEV